MLTKEQEEWLNHLSDTHTVKIIPFNPKVKSVFQKIKSEIQSKLSVEVLHRGASSMGISGKGDIDIYIPIAEKDFEDTFEKLSGILGKPGSHYPNQRARWNRDDEGFEVEIFLVNTSHESWLKSVAFENYLLSNHEALQEYRIIKEEAEGLSTREYYRKKIEFMNKIIDLAGK